MSLASDLAKISERRKEDIEEIAQASLLRLSTRVVKATPVDTGAAKRNWLSAYGAADTSTTDDTDATGGVAIGSVAANLSGLTVGDTFYLTNSLPYIQRLEFGWSEKAPNGMLRLNLLSWDEIVTSEVNKRK